MYGGFPCRSLENLSLCIQIVDHRYMAIIREICACGVVENMYVHSNMIYIYVYIYIWLQHMLNLYRRAA